MWFLRQLLTSQILEEMWVCSSRDRCSASLKRREADTLALRHGVYELAVVAVPLSDIPLTTHPKSPHFNS